MSGKLVTNPVQINDSATATNNFVLKADNAGGIKLSRGNDGATTQDIFSVSPAGALRVDTSPAFSAYQSSAQSLSNGIDTKLLFQTKEFDTTTAYDTSTSRFTPQLAGYYQISGGFKIATTQTSMVLTIRKNGVSAKLLNFAGSATAGLCGSALVFLNGTTDYIELYGQQDTTAQNTVPQADQTYFQAFLARAS